LAELAFSTPEPDLAAPLEAEVDEATATCAGDARAAVRTLLVVNAFLEQEKERFQQPVSAGFSRRKIGPPAEAEGVGEAVRLVGEGSRVSDVLYYVALPFVPTEDGIAAGQAQECTTGGAAIRQAEFMSRKAPNVGALAFKRTGDPGLGSFADATVLKTFSDVPEKLDEL
jgi:hypothetical protein